MRANFQPLADVELRSRIAFVVYSCDRYADLWDLFFDRLRRLWPDLPLSVYLLTNERAYDRFGVQTLRAGPDRDWSSSIYTALNQLNEEYVFGWFDDAFIRQQVDAAEVNRYLSWGLARNADYLRLRHLPPPQRSVAHNIGRLAEGMPYRVTCQAALYRRSTFLSLLQPGESAAQFEMEGTRRSYAFHRFYGVYRPPVPIIHGVVGGKWLPAALDRLELTPESHAVQRPVMSWSEYSLWRVRELKGHVAVRLPAGWANRVFSAKRMLNARSR